RTRFGPRERRGSPRTSGLSCARPSHRRPARPAAARAPRGARTARVRVRFAGASNAARIWDAEVYPKSAIPSTIMRPLLERPRAMRFTGSAEYVSTDDLTLAVNAPFPLQAPAPVDGDP